MQLPNNLRTNSITKTSPNYKKNKGLLTMLNITQI